MKRICGKCRKTKDINEFYTHTKGKDGFRTTCKKCHIKTCTEYRKDHPLTQEQKLKNRDSSLAWKMKLKEIIREAKNVPCPDCNERYPYMCMEFDHVRGQKEFNIGQSSANVSKDRLLREMQKCEVVCANCHRTIHFNLLEKI